MVFVHGGAFVFGAGSAAISDGRNWPREETSW